MTKQTLDLESCLELQRFLDWLRKLGDRPCGRYGDPCDNVVCRFLREATPLKGATLDPGDWREEMLLACDVPQGGGRVEMRRVSSLPQWVYEALLVEKALHDEAVDASAVPLGVEIPARDLLARLSARLGVTA